MRIGAIVAAGVLAIGFVSTGSVLGQRQMPKMLDASVPDVGDKLPDISVYDSKGEKVRLRALEGKHKVIVFGCLT